jgi:sugar phosphate isomerase/epimerase
MPKITLCAFSDEASSGFDGQMSALLRNGIPYMEMRSVDGGNVKDLTVSEASEYKKRLDDKTLAVWSVGSPIGKSDIKDRFNKVEDDLKHVCELALTLGADKIRMFSFHNAFNARSEVLERLSRMVEIAEPYGVKLCHENEKDIYGDTLSRVQDIMDNVRGLCHVYDPANFLQVGESAEKTLSHFHCKAEYFHIKDVISSTGELVPPGYGDGRIDKLIANIKTDKVLTVEPHLRIFDGYGKIDNTEMKHKFHFTDNNEAFDMAVNELKKLLREAGYTENERSFIK